MVCRPIRVRSWRSQRRHTVASYRTSPISNISPRTGVAAYLRDVWAAVSELKKQGVPAEEAAKRADLSKHKERFPNPAVPLIGAQRIYALIDGTAK